MVVRGYKQVPEYNHLGCLNDADSGRYVWYLSQQRRIFVKIRDYERQFGAAILMNHD
jgi:hypothetical protein